jgi:hypothetical protein
MMLDAHPELAIPPETNFLPGIAHKCRGATDPHACFVAHLTSRTRWPDFHVDNTALAQRVSELPVFDLGDALRAFYALYADRFNKRRWGDKTPRYIEYMTMIIETLPEARFVHVVRDGRDVALSFRDLWFGPNSARETADWWKAKIEVARRQSDSLPYCLEIRYEDLVLNTEPVLRRVCNFLDLSWDDRLLQYYERADERVAELTTTVVSSDRTRIVSAEERRDIFVLTGKPPDASRIGRWRADMSGEDRRAFWTIAGETLREFGYDEH